jgi:hypothetical protein
LTYPIEEIGPDETIDEDDIEVTEGVISKGHSLLIGFHSDHDLSDEIVVEIWWDSGWDIRLWRQGIVLMQENM